MERFTHTHKIAFINHSLLTEDCILHSLSNSYPENIASQKQFHFVKDSCVEVYLERKGENTGVGGGVHLHIFKVLLLV